MCPLRAAGESISFPIQLQFKSNQGAAWHRTTFGVPSISIDIECDSLLTAVTACKQTEITVAIDLAPAKFPSTHIFGKIHEAFSS
jgi:hypothetical protein